MSIYDEPQTKLKPCPFCGGTSLFIVKENFGDLGDYVYCDDCEAQGPWVDNPEEAWNKRHETD